MKKKNNQIVLLSTAANVYQTETGTANKTLNALKEELNQVINMKTNPKKKQVLRQEHGKWNLK